MRPHPRAGVLVSNRWKRLMCDLVRRNVSLRKTAGSGDTRLRLWNNSFWRRTKRTLQMRPTASYQKLLTFSTNQIRSPDFLHSQKPLETSSGPRWRRRLPVQKRRGARSRQRRGPALSRSAHEGGSRVKPDENRDGSGSLGALRPVWTPPPRTPGRSSR